jgi:hypothetical protein
VADAAQQRVHCIGQCALEPVPIEFDIRLHVTDGGLDLAAPSDQRS